jgi:hypothetical protein
MAKFTPFAVVLINTPTSIWMAHVIGVDSLRIELSGNPHTWLRQALAKVADVHPHYKPRGLCINMQPKFCVESDLQGRVIATHETMQVPVTYLHTLH